MTKALEADNEVLGSFTLAARKKKLTKIEEDGGIFGIGFFNKNMCLYHVIIELNGI